jgi:hypothetical protein
MRWDSLFDDLESQLERELTAEDADVAAEEERLRLARLGMRDRLVGIAGDPIGLVLVGGRRLTARLSDIGRDWAALRVEGPPAWSGVVPFEAIESVIVHPGAARSSIRGVETATGQPSLTERLGFAFVLRDLCRRRRYVRLELESGEIGGTIDRVARDHLDVAVHAPDAPRRESAIREVRIVPLRGVRLVTLARFSEFAGRT